MTKFEFLVTGRLVGFKAGHLHTELSLIFCGPAGAHHVVVSGVEKHEERSSPTANALSNLLPGSVLLLSIG